MPRVVGKGGKVEHLPYTEKGMARAAAAKKRGAQVGYGRPPKEEPMREMREMREMMPVRTRTRRTRKEPR